jgi:5-bromo-4-chloroindolyl phosphate hydrolysis protein
VARQFGGKFSPEASRDADDDTPPTRGAYDGARVEPAGARVNLLFIPAISLVFMAFGDGAIALALALAAAAILTAGAWLTREGLRAQAAYDARRVARRPAFPRKLAGSLLIGLGIALAAFKTQGTWADPGAAGIAAAALYGGLAAGLHVVAFGLDPMKDKGMEGIDSFQQDRVARVVDEGEAYLSAMSDAIERAGDPKAAARVERFQTTARELFRTVEEDPRDLSAARRYMTVYLRGARDATIRFADINARTRDRQARADYIALLDDLEQNFAARTRAMLLDDRADLTIEIEVLRERLQREGVRSD